MPGVVSTGVVSTGVVSTGVVSTGVVSTGVVSTTVPPGGVRLLTGFTGPATTPPSVAGVEPMVPSGLMVMVLPSS